MRDILFRGKRKDNGQFIEGFYIFDGFNHYIVKFYTDENAEGTLYPVQETFEVDPETVGQYTGLTDENGTKVFEGDIIEWDEKEWGCEHRELVEWNYSLFSQRKNDWKEFCKVIGNIHDNPELLEVK